MSRMHSALIRLTDMVLVAEIAAFIDGRTAVSAHGNREMPVWGERFGEMVGGGSLGEEVVRGNLLVLMEYLKTIQR